MAQIEIKNVFKRFGDFVAVNDANLTIAEKEFVVLVGPSGCGKTTLLRTVAGLGMADEGQIMIGGRDVTYLPPRERKISMVFQSYAIFPHMSVKDNIAFGLKMTGVDKKETDRRVHEASEMLHIENLLDRFPSKMSGGQRQRVAVARAIAMQAEVLLMDEPLSNLDALLRLEMRAELKKLLNDIGATTIYVTHDQIEALSMGDRIAIMKDGVIQQVSEPTTLYDKPNNQFVGSFIGNPPMNFMHGMVQKQDGQLKVAVGDASLTPDNQAKGLLSGYTDREIVLGIRAENMETLLESAPDAIPVTVDVVEPLGSQNLLTVKMGSDTIKVSTHPDMGIQSNQQVWLRFPADKIRWINRDSGNVLYE
ncbi:MAG: ABC transporter ATP-binding protein [Chloroflexota bacterium]